MLPTSQDLGKLKHETAAGESRRETAADESRVEAVAGAIWTGYRRAQRRRRYDGLVTEAECARRQIPDAPLPPLCGGPA